MHVLNGAAAIDCYPVSLLLLAAKAVCSIRVSEDEKNNRREHYLFLHPQKPKKDQVDNVIRT